MFSKIGVLAFLAITTQSAAAQPPYPKLIVAIAVDQFSAGLFSQYRSRLTGGLHRLGTEGVVFENGYQSHAATETCPGHSTILTGRHPSGTGIIANNWYDPATRQEEYCVYDPQGPVPHRPTQPRGPANLRVSTLGEWMKAANPASRVYGVSSKDRAAIMMTGHNPDGVFWWDNEYGFTTSVPEGTSAGQRLAPVARLNAEVAARWAKAPPAWNVVDKSCLALTGPHRYGHLTIDHELPPKFGAPGQAGFNRADPAIAEWLRASPITDQLTLDLAGDLINQFSLGRREAPDLLAISLSSTDAVGHIYGSQGPEMCDQMAHLDASLGAFMRRLEALRIPVLVVLTADHGAMDAAERVAERGVPGSRVQIGGVIDNVSTRVRSELRLDFDPLIPGINQVRIATTDPVLRRRIEERAVALLRESPLVGAAFGRSEIAAATIDPRTPPDELTLIQRFAESEDAQHSGDIEIAPYPFTEFEADPTRSQDSVAGHGSPWNYDRRVPIVFWWPGADGFEQPLPIETVDIAPTLAAALAIPTPKVDGRCRDLDRSVANMCDRLQHSTGDYLRLLKR